MNTWPNGKISDRVLGIVVTLTGGAALYLLREWLVNMRNRRKSIRSNIDINEAIRLDTDELYSVRYSLLEKVHHMGSCHCRRVQFRIRAPKVLNAFDIHSKVRYPRIMIKGEDFENLTDESLLSLYPVTNNNGNSIGIHAFCSYCGVHVLYSPSEDPKEVQINVDCLDQKTIEKVNVSYYGTSDLVPCSLSDNRSKMYSRTGTGASNVPSLISNLSDSESVADTLPGTEPLHMMSGMGGTARGRGGGTSRSRNFHLHASDLDEALVFVEECELGLGDEDDIDEGNSLATGVEEPPYGMSLSTPPRDLISSPGRHRDLQSVMEDASDHSGATTQSSTSGRAAIEVLNASTSSGTEATPTTALHKRLRTHLYRHLHPQSGRSSAGSSSSSTGGRSQRSSRSTSIA